jgi:hypothetical protein
MTFVTEVRSQIKLDDIILIQPGKNESFISYTEFGKVIIIVNCPDIKIGYAKVTNVIKESEKFIMVEAINIAYDYYNDIGYDEFIEVLKLLNYKIGFERPFQSDYGNDYQLLAYNVDTGIVIIGETYYGGKTFNSIKVHCPNVCATTRLPCFSMGNVNMSILDLCYGRNIKNMLRKLDLRITNPVWHVDEDLSLWTYIDSKSYLSGVDYRWGFSASILWGSTIDRLLLVDEDIEQILGGCDRFKPIFAKRIKLK